MADNQFYLKAVEHTMENKIYDKVFIPCKKKTALIIKDQVLSNCENRLVRYIIHKTFSDVYEITEQIKGRT